MLFDLDTGCEDIQAFQRDCEARIATRRSSCSRLPTEINHRQAEQLSLLDYAAMEQDLIDMAASTAKPEWEAVLPASNSDPRFFCPPSQPPADLSQDSYKYCGQTLLSSASFSSTSSHGSGLLSLSPYHCATDMELALPSLMLTDPGDIVQQRQEALQRYRAKKANRMFTKTVRYQLRKVNADRRPRIKGRFVKKAEQERLASAASRYHDDAVASSSSMPSDEEEEYSS